MEADVQFRRDRLVEKKIVEILGKRVDDCRVHYYYIHGTGTGRAAERAAIQENHCKEVEDAYMKGIVNFHIKYGDISGSKVSAVEVLMKQKHRMIWERRHGPNMMQYQQEAMETAEAKKLSMGLYDKLVRRWYLFLGDLKNKDGEWR